MKVLITCPKLITNIDDYQNLFNNANIEYSCPRVLQQLEKEKLLELVKNYDGWIAGDDIADYDVLKEGKNGKLKVLIKWGVGTDNVDKKACEELGIKFDHTPNMFGNEVANVAMGYLIMMTRHLHITNENGKNGKWVNIQGTSLKDKNALVIGFGNIGHNLVERLKISKVNVSVYDPYYKKLKSNVFFNSKRNICRTYENIDLYENLETMKKNINKKDIIIVCCDLNKNTKHLINDELFNLMKDNVYLINVARGPIVETKSLVKNLDNGKLKGFAADVFETEPYDENFVLCNKKYKNVILGAHNASNTAEAVDKTSREVIRKLFKLLGITEN